MMMYKQVIDKSVVKIEMESNNLSLLFDLSDAINKVIEETYPYGGWNEED